MTKYEDLRPCEWKENRQDDWKIGRFHRWFQYGSEEGDSEGRGVIETENGNTVTTCPEYIRFTDHDTSNDEGGEK